MLAGFASAEVIVGNASNSLTKTYGPGQNVSGWINISLDDEPANEIFKDNNKNNISLIDVLRNQTEYKYACFPSSCRNSYTSSNGNETKSFSMRTGETKSIGIKITGEIRGISSFSGFNVNSSAESDCYNQIKFDFNDDGVYEKGNNNYTTGSCSSIRNYGCYNASKTTSDRNIGETPYCQRIELNEAPGFKIGAWVKKSGDTKTIRIFLKDLYGETIDGAGCNLPDASTAGEEIFCEISYALTEPEEYYVCISSDSSTGYKIKGYDDSTRGCGFFGEELEDERASYKIFAESMMFGKADSLKIDDTLPNSNTISSLIEEYLMENYEDSDDSCSSECIADCSETCIIPITIKSGKSQNVVLKNLNLKYRTATGETTASEFYDLEENPAKINSAFGKLNINKAGFSVPETFGNYSFILFLGSTKILTEKFYIEKVPVILKISPSLTASGLPTEFKVDVNSSYPIQSYLWKFGDGKEQLSTDNKIFHTYNSTGSYELKIEVTDSQNKIASKTVTIKVESAKSAIDSLLLEKKNLLKNISVEINKLSAFYKKEIEAQINIDYLDDELKNLEKEKGTAYKEEDYSRIINELFYLEIPSDIKTSAQGKDIVFVPSNEVIDLNVIKEIEQGSYNSANDYKNAVYSWNQENLDASISFDEISGVYDSEVKSLGKFYKLKFNKKQDIGYDYYFVIENIKNLSFAENYLQNSKGNYYYINIKDKNEIEFFSSEDISFEELPAFISPGLERLSLQASNIQEYTYKNYLAVMFLIIVLILGIGFVIYIFMQEWYKRKYENYLFRDQTHLYNLIVYINNSEKKQISEGEIAKKLRNAGWTSEQVTYALKKYSGKRTGMIEIPIEKLLNLFKKKEEENKMESPEGNLIVPRAVSPLTFPPKIPFGFNRFQQQSSLDNKKTFFKPK